jgi:hypothetical protein
VSVPQCAELTSAANGIQFCDVTEGSGKSPAKGSLIRCLLVVIVRACVL